MLNLVELDEIKGISDQTRFNYFICNNGSDHNTLIADYNGISQIELEIQYENVRYSSATLPAYRLYAVMA